MFLSPNNIIIYVAGLFCYRPESIYFILLPLGSLIYKTIHKTQSLYFHDIILGIELSCINSMGIL